jgi:DNA-binding MarR family transcriptional regulator
MLTAVERGEPVSQLVLSKRVGVAVGLLNALLRRAARKGYVKVTSVPAKRYAYYLTPKGFAEKGRLIVEYLDQSLSFFRQARDQYEALFEGARAAGRARIALYGCGELAEIAVVAAMNTDVVLVGIVDRAANKPMAYGLPVVRALDDLEAWDVIVLTDGRTPQLSYNDLLAVVPADRLLLPEFLRVSRLRPVAAASRAGAGR